MTFIRYIALILISISLIVCASSKSASAQSIQKDNTMGTEMMIRRSDESWVGLEKAYIEYDKIIKSKVTTTAEKEEAEAVLQSIMKKDFLSLNKNFPIPQYSEQDEKDAMLDLYLARTEAKKNNITLQEEILSMPTDKAARLLRLISPDREYFLKPKNNTGKVL